jgi:hypothetical protein
VCLEDLEVLVDLVDPLILEVLEDPLILVVP